jgi:hypothetical protein
MVKKLRDPVYNRYIYILYNMTRYEFNNYCKSKFNYEYAVDEGVKGALRQVMYRDTMVFLLWIEKIGNTPDMLSTLLHECIHLSGAVLRYLGVYVRVEDDEALCYYTEYLYKQIIKHIESE